MLWVSAGVGVYVYPIYTSFFIYLDKTASLSRVKKRDYRMTNKTTNFRILTLARSLCVFTEVHNVHAQDLAMLSQIQHKYLNSIPENAFEIGMQSEKALDITLQIDGH